LARKIKFLGTWIRHVDLRRDDSGDMARMDLSCTLTQTLARELSCEDAIATTTVKRATLDIAEIPLSSMSLSYEGLEKNDLNIDAIALRDLVVVSGGEDGTINRELRFHVTVPGESIALIREYWAAIGGGKALLTITRLAEQATLEEQPVEETSPLEIPKQPTLASVRDMQ
jgi:hypothetical protein